LDLDKFGKGRDGWLGKGEKTLITSADPEIYWGAVLLLSWLLLLVQKSDAQRR
jgi:hypothetical protein